MSKNLWRKKMKKIIKEIVKFFDKYTYEFLIGVGCMTMLVYAIIELVK